jgi:hypothetical protein
LLNPSSLNAVHSSTPSPNNPANNSTIHPFVYPPNVTFNSLLPMYNTSQQYAIDVYTSTQYLAKHCHLLSSHVPQKSSLV